MSTRKPTALFTHSECLGHQTPAGHPEQVARLHAIETALADRPGLLRLDAPSCSDEDILLCHPRSHLQHILSSAPAQGLVMLDEDTHMSPGSVLAARRAVGGALAAVDTVLSGQAHNAFVATRPPGHHAERSRQMGFCLFGNVALAAQHALQRHGLGRVAIVDFDVHHGNGTQDLLWDEQNVLFFSSHQMPLWPGSGRADETGAHGQVVNLPLAPGSDGKAMRALYQASVFPQIDAFRPDLVLISAGFDAHSADPLAQLHWHEDDFVWLTQN
ncbi:MAG: histone deacetylase family protein, partial [Lutimaribacter sp.]